MYVYGPGGRVEDEEAPTFVGHSSTFCWQTLAGEKEVCFLFEQPTHTRAPTQTYHVTSFFSIYAHSPLHRVQPSANDLCRVCAGGGQSKNVLGLTFFGLLALKYGVHPGVSLPTRQAGV